MKKILFLVGILGFLATSCTDNREDGYMPSKVYMIKSGVQEYASTSDQTSAVATAWATKSGLLGASCVVTYSVDAQYLTSYNEANGSEYELLPESCYTIEQTSFSLSPDDLNAKFFVTYYPLKIYELCGSYNSPEKYALPIRMDVEGLESLEDRTHVLMTFNISAPN